MKGFSGGAHVKGFSGGAHVNAIMKIRFLHKIKWGYSVAQLVEALRYKPEGRGFDFRWCHWNFSLT